MKVYVCNGSVFLQGMNAYVAVVSYRGVFIYVCMYVCLMYVWDCSGFFNNLKAAGLLSSSSSASASSSSASAENAAVLDTYRKLTALRARYVLWLWLRSIFLE